MGRRLEVQNVGKGPRGLPTIGKSSNTVFDRGEIKTVDVEDSVAAMIERDTRQAKPVWSIEKDHGSSGDGAEAPKPAKTETKPAPGGGPPPSAGALPKLESGRMDFEKFTDDQLWAFLEANGGSAHKQTGRKKLLIKVQELEAKIVADAETAAKARAGEQEAI